MTSIQVEVDGLEEMRIACRLPAPRVARSIRRTAGVTQDALATAVGVHRVTLARWEKGTSEPRGAHRVQYVRILEELRSAAVAS